MTPKHNAASSASLWRKMRVLASILALVLTAALALAWAPAQALADGQAAQPSVLLVDANLGDTETFSYRWLAAPESVELVAENGSHALTTTANPSWWQSAASQPAPATYLLSSPSNKAITADSVVWALDQLAAHGANPKTVIVAFGAAGYPVREYLGDAASVKQSARADVVGVAFVGTAHNGFSVMESYPELGIWDAIAASVGLSRSDLAPSSGYLSRLNQLALPRTVKALSISGSVGNLGFGDTDGAAVMKDFALSTAISDRVEVLHVNASVGQRLNLSGEWLPFTNQINYPNRTVDEHLAEIISSFDSYSTNNEVKAKLSDFYSAWFSNTDPVTHVSNVVALDLSGSMFEEIVPGSVKIDVAKNAAREYLQAAEASDGLPYAAPVDVSIIGFSTELKSITSGYDSSARSAVGAMNADPKETNIGIALEDALAKLGSAPACASKRILLLSDGATTEGMTNEEMLAGPIARAASAGIVIDAIGFGNVGESNAEFLKQASAATGGTYYQADDTFDVEVDFLRAFYSSLGMSLTDETVSSSQPFELGESDARTVAWNVGVVGKGFAPSLSLSCDGAPVDPERYTTSTEGSFTALRMLDPAPGAYTLNIAGGTSDAHVFAIRQTGIASAMQMGTPIQDNGLVFLIVTGVALLASIAAAVVFTKRRSAGAR